MKIVSDFDGVLTDLTEEGHRVREILREELLRVSGRKPAQVDQWLAFADAELDRNPHLHGWKVRGRVTAFANEDLFIRNNGLASCLELWAARDEHGLADLKGALEREGFADFNAFANHCYGMMLKETQAGQIKPIDPQTRGMIEALLGAGHELVVVSNSGTQRILEIFASGGIQAVSHDQDPRARFRVRGGAMKFELGDVSRGFEVGAYFVETSRPHYERILEEERPGAVIGDVFSLDLALPLHLARTRGSAFEGMRLFLRGRHYTPVWSREKVLGSREPAAKLRVLGELSELPAAISE
ncbi:MAG: hypothetical protein NDJ89_17325 [Oligoflexia bacterium]|nr:hypothetical protein [Oligoflexia bacterium]